MPQSDPGATLNGMKNLPVDIAYLYEVFLEQAERLLDHLQAQPAGSPEQDDPQRLIGAMSDLCKLLREAEACQAGESTETACSPEELEALGNFGLQLLNDLSELAAKAELADCARELENLCLPLGVWIARHGVEIQQLAPVVNALAWHANQTRSPEDMQVLYGLATEIVEAVNPHLSEVGTCGDLHPWRLLLINRAIVATRTHQPSLMEPAFTAVVEQLPEDAPRFFAEGMQQMDRVGYPEPVREVMRRFHALFSEKHTLH